MTAWNSPETPLFLAGGYAGENPASLMPRDRGSVTRRAVNRCPFDDDAVLLWPREARKLLHDRGFAGVSHAYIVFFPRWLAFLRRFEPWLSWLPLGGQTLLIASKPVIPTASASS